MFISITIVIKSLNSCSRNNILELIVYAVTSSILFSNSSFSVILPERLLSTAVKPVFISHLN